jgi:uncharacterized protein Usg
MKNIVAKNVAFWKKNLAGNLHVQYFQEKNHQRLFQKSEKILH